MSLFKLFSRSAPTVPAVAVEKRASLASSGRWNASQVARQCIYPPEDPGFPAVDPAEILHGAQIKLERLAEIAGGTASEFDRLYIGPLTRLASQVHLLPATPNTYYSGPAGLFNMCLDIALMSRQAAEGKIFVPEATIEIRHKTEGAWRYSAFLAGLICQLYVPVGSMTVLASDGRQWPRYNSSIYQWLSTNAIDRYFVSWHEKARVTGAEGASLLATVVPPDIMDWLASTDPQIIRDLNIAATREMNASESILGAILRSVIARVKEVDLVQLPSRYGKLTVGTQFEVHFLNALRELIESKKWIVNQIDGPVYWGSDGLYIAWPKAMDDVISIFERRKLHAMPRSSVTLAEMLGLSGAVISRDAGVWVHDIVVTSKTGDISTLSAMRFKDPDVLLGHLEAIALTTPFGKLLVDAQAEALKLVAQKETAAISPVTESPNAPNPGQVPNAEPSAAPTEEVLTPQKGLPKAAAQRVDKPVKQADARPAVLEHVEEVLPGTKVPVEVLARLRLKDTDDAASALGLAIEQSRAYRSDRVRTLDWGVAICTTWLTQVAGYGVGDLASPLERAGVIARHPESKSVASICKVMFSDSETPRMALVLKPEFASKLGMAMDSKV